MKLFYLVLAGIGSFAVSAYAQDTVQDVGKWKIISRQQSDGHHSCTLQSPANADGIYFFLGNLPMNDGPSSQSIGFLSIIFPTKVIDKDTDTIKDVVFSISARTQWQPAEAAWRANNAGGALSASLGDEITVVLEPFARGKSLQIRATSLTTSISLDGSYGAVLAYKDCIQISR